MNWLLSSCGRRRRGGLGLERGGGVCALLLLDKQRDEHLTDNPPRRVARHNLNFFCPHTLLSQALLRALLCPALPCPALPCAALLYECIDLTGRGNE